MELPKDYVKGKTKRQRAQKHFMRHHLSGVVSENALVSNRDNCQIPQTSDFNNKDSILHFCNGQVPSFHGDSETSQDEPDPPYMIIQREDQDYLQQRSHSTSQKELLYSSIETPNYLNLSSELPPDDVSLALSIPAKLPLPPKISSRKSVSVGSGLSNHIPQYVGFMSKEDQYESGESYQYTTKNSHDKCEDLGAAEQKYSEFMPLFACINGKNYKDLLLKVLKECSHHILLDDFYNQLYNFESPDQVVSTPVDGLKIATSDPSPSRLEGLNLCHRILGAFRSHSDSRLTAYSGQKVSISVNFPDICKNFLALKIIFDSFKKNKNVSGPEFSLSRISVYKAYYIICKKLLQKYPVKSESSIMHSNIILNDSQIGKIIRLVFPEINSKRFGKRGSSTFHYLGLTWNELVIGEEIKNLIELPLPDIDSNLQQTQSQGINETAHYQTNPSLHGNEMLSPASPSTLQTPSLNLSNRKPIFSFVYLSSTFPVADCFLRSWEIIPGKVPQQSAWAKETMNKSIKALRNRNIDMDALINIINGPEFCAESLDIFLDGVLSMISHLVDVSAPEILHLHLYLVTSTLIFPIIFASRKEVSSRHKSQLRESLSQFVGALEKTSKRGTSFCNLMGFVKIVRKMINFNNLLSLQSGTSILEDILRGMFGDASSDFSTSTELLRDILTREALNSCNAFSWEFVETTLRESPQHQILIVKSIVNAYLKFVVSSSDIIGRIPGALTDDDLKEPTYELSYYIFEVMSKAFHEIFLQEAYILQLPVKLIASFLRAITSEFHSLSIRNSAKREAELSKEISKCWWAHLNSVYEYMDIISEITALHVLLNVGS